MTEQRRGSGQGRPPAKRSGASGGRSAGSGARVARRRARGGSGGGRSRWTAADRRLERSRVATASGEPGSRERGARAEGAKGGDRRDQGTRGGRGETARRVTGGGFGPYAVDQRDEETREKRGAKRSDERRPSRGHGRALGAADRRQAHRPRREAARARRRTRRPTTPTRRRRKRGPADVQQEMAKVAGRNANRALGTLMAAADAFAHDRERETLRILRPLREQLPDSPSVRELAGLAQYRIGNYAAAAKELEAYADLSDSVDQNPVLMDCYRAQRRWRKVEELWLELAAVSPTAELVAEGRIVYAGALADQGRLPEALALLRKRAERVKSPKEYHLRLWYALADLEERAGNLARARELFHQVRRADPASPTWPSASPRSG